MFDYDVDSHSGSEVLAQIGLDSRAIHDILAEPATFDPRRDAEEEE